MSLSARTEASALPRIMLPLLLWAGALGGCATAVVEPDGGLTDTSVSMDSSDSMSDDGALDGAPDGLVDAYRPPLCSDQDLDGDGFGSGAECPSPDCDDTNPSVHPGAMEACNGVDDDCDEAVDERLNNTICGGGECRREVPNCVDGAINVCIPGEPTEEACNGLDDDCDGTADEGLAEIQCGQGACARTVACVNGVADECIPGVPAEETCDGVDRDCDGSIDEGFFSQVVNTRYATMSTFHPPCDGENQRLGPDCNAAIKRFCATQTCAVTGFGPLENSAGDLSVGCVNRPAQRVDYEVLAGHHPVCDGGTERVGPSCNAAIHRYCQSEGFVSGYGPVESGQTFVFLVCVGDGAQMSGTTYAELAQHHPACNGRDENYGSACNAAIHRRCTSLGFETGFGPVENDGDVAVTICLRP